VDGAGSSVEGRARSTSAAVRGCVLAAGVCVALGMPGSAAAAVSTDQPSYAPGSTVTISGGNSDGARYAPGEAVRVVVSGPSSYAASCTATADGSGAWSCQIALASDASAIGSYSYTATGETSGVSQTGSFTDSGCPSSDRKGVYLEDPKVSASFASAGGVATYSFKSTNESPVGGIPGLIEYCVYTSSLPSSDLALYSNIDGAWTSGSGGGFFDFERSDGDPNNVPFDGTTQTIGTATWNSGTVPSAGEQTIVLHINDPAECSALYGGSPLTCFVLPGKKAKDLTAKKTATPAFTRTYTWGIGKSVDKTQVDTSGGAAKFNYTVKVTHDSGTDSLWEVTGEISVENPNGAAVSGVEVTDAINNDPNATCSVTGGSGAEIPANGEKKFPYSCTYSSTPAASSQTNTATVKWGTQTLSNGSTLEESSTTATAPVDWSSTTPTIVDGSVSVEDSLTTPHSLGTVSYTDTSPKEFEYSLEFNDPAGKCTSHTNTAKFTTSDTSTTGSASQTVKDCQGADLKVSKTASPSFTRTYTWGIGKSVDKTQVDTSGGAAKFKYTVKVTHDSGTDSLWEVTGTIKVENPNEWEPITLTGVADEIDNGGSCSITSGSTIASIPASSSVTLGYKCTYASAPSPTSFTNKATANWDKTAASTPDGEASGKETGEFNTPTTVVHNSVSLSDLYTTEPSPLPLGFSAALSSGALPSGTISSSGTYTYTYVVTVPHGCMTLNNTASLVATDEATYKKSDSTSATVCRVPVKTGALTMGFWQNKNGQAIITGGASTGGVCNSGTWLRQYAPFQDLSATASCSTVASYVTNVIKEAVCTSTSKTCNAMLKAQMLATALDVYFSNPALGGNKIGAPAPIGGVTIDLTQVCQMIDGSGGTGTCGGTYENASSAFGGASSLTVSQMLAYAASQSTVGGTTWYANVKATQVLAKDAFDAINNGVAFSP
jgi:hypothetical protein